MDKEKLMVSSTVYGSEDLLDNIYGQLSEKYNVFMSHKGTVINNSNHSCYQDCRKAVEDCDIFLGIITPSYGSGLSKSNPFSITHQEMVLAKDLNKKRYYIVNDKVIFSSTFLEEMSLDINTLKKNGKKLRNLVTDLYVVQMYRDILENEPSDYFKLESYLRFSEAESKIQNFLL
ncbi:DUF4062 domain-containing protein [Acinetobacter seifertii]|uniref:DUF4062 domain-containing protein n=1 Tax=Acinetobacter seifertii TaxID=1530123 RepID=UPI00280CE1E4|nr:DUF4062 domain-containing protein [Acinetobacter seifertii]MDQ9038766.1 DUF4062 domain-containing protein [Acinetobacter seifertii]